MRVVFIAVRKEKAEDCGEDHYRLRKFLESSGFQVIDGGIITAKGRSRSIPANLLQKDPDLALLLTASGRSAGFLETMVRSSALPCIIWAMDRGYALASSCLAIGALQESGYRQVKLVYGSTWDRKVRAEFLKVSRVCCALTGLRRSKIGIVGKLFPNLVSCRYDREALQKKIGVKLVNIPYDELRTFLRKVGKDAVTLKRLQQKICRSYTVRVDKDDLLPGLELHLVLKRLAKDKDLRAFALECWTGLPPKIGLNPCLGFIENNYVMACEGDVMLGVSLLMAKYITGSIPYVGDIYSIDKKNILTLRHCGGPASLSKSKKVVILDKSLLATQYGFTTFTCRPQLSKGKVTLIRLYGKNVDKMHVASGEIVDCDTSQDLTVFIKLAGDRSDFLEHCMGNHYLVVSGNILEELKLFCNWLNIDIVET